MDFLKDIDAALTPIDIALGLLACIVAVVAGMLLAKKQAQAFRGGHAQQSHGELPAVTFADYGDMRFLHLGSPAVQGSMKISAPYDLHLEYVQRMMAWLLFADLNQVKHMHAMQLGLGAASLTKFCRQHLDMQTTAIELNPQVIDTCKRWFKLPENSAKLNVVLADAGEAVAHGQWQGAIDALQVDLYDQESARPVIDTDEFYRNCRNLLSQHGCMTVNLFGHAANDAKSVQKIKAAFGEDAVWTFKPTTAGNTIVLAFCRPPMFERDALQQQAQAIQDRWSLPAVKWLNTLAPVKSAL
jgi:spermidine synthase